jgi:hypothetical protein
MEEAMRVNTRVRRMVVDDFGSRSKLYISQDSQDTLVRQYDLLEPKSRRHQYAGLRSCSVQSRPLAP